MNRYIKPFQCAECSSTDLLVNMRARLTVVNGCMEARMLDETATDDLSPYCIDCDKGVTLAVDNEHKWNVVVCAENDTDHTWSGIVVADTLAQAQYAALGEVSITWERDEDDLEVVDCFNVADFIRKYSN